MRIKGVRIHNITSIKDADIDFEQPPLYGSGLFLISGEIGSGKSTILDSICVGLYNRTPRLSSWQSKGMSSAECDNMAENSTQQLLRRGSGEGFVRVRFVSEKGDDYEVEWSVRRARNKPTGAIQGIQWILRDSSGEMVSDKIRQTERTIVSLTGLDFEQFCRTTVLAQGEFTRFLNSTDSDKAGILEKITGTGIYGRVGQLIFEKLRAYKNTRERVIEKISSVEVLSAESAKALESEAADIDIKVKELDCELNRLSCVRADIAKLRELYDSLSKSKEEDLVQRAEFGHLKSSFSLYKSTLSSMERNLKELNSEIERYAGRRSVLINGELAVSKLRDLINIRVELASLACQSERAEREGSSLKTDRLIPAEEGVSAVMAELSMARKSLEAEEARVSACGEGCLISDEKRHHAMELELKDCESAFRMESKERALLESMREEAAKGLEELESARKDFSLQCSAIKVKEAARDAAKSVYERMSRATDEYVKSLRSHLRVGDECPVCQRIVEVLPDEGELENNLKPFKDEYERLDIEFEDCRRRLNENEIRLVSAERVYFQVKRKSDDDRSFLEAKASADRLRKESGLSDLSACAVRREQLESEGLSLRVRRDALSKAKAGELSCRARVRNLESDLVRLQETVEHIRGLINEKSIEYSTLQGALEEKIASQKSIEDWLREFLGDSYTGWDENPSEVESALAGDIKMFKSLSEDYAANERRLQDARSLSEEISGIVCALESDLGSDGPYEGEEHSGMHLLNGFISLRARMAERKRSEQGFRSEICVLEERLRGISEEDVISSENSARHTRDVLSRRSGELSARMNLDKERMQVLLSLDKEKGALDAEILKWEKLSPLSDQKGQKFRKIAQSYILGNLVESANRYLDDLSGRYRLAHEPGEFTLYVEDSWEGNVRRPASGISGGESFLVSLSLALSLTDFGGNLRVDTLFIDEGFGTLSGTALHKAVDVLRNLHLVSGRQVGIISHISDLKEMIGVQVLVEREGMSSWSRIRVTG